MGKQVTNKGRKKNVPEPVLTTDEAVLLANRSVELYEQLSRLEGQKANELQQVQDKYVEELGALNKEWEENRKKAEAYYNANDAILDVDGKRSHNFGFFYYGKRKSNPKLVLKTGFIKEEAVFNLKQCFPEYVRTSEEVDKEAILRDRSREGLLVLLEDCGLEVVQKDNFFMEVKVPS
jgi:phage host-nuclease inhibitor protein Gam